ncbi:MAG: hypothetical protein ABIQ16_10210 [Polyangiaceae bacterium]
MQQTKSYWRLVTITAVAGVAMALVGTACTITTSTDAGGAAGDFFAGGPGTGGGATAGAGGAATAGAGVGGAATAGAAGAGKVPYGCTPDSGDPLGTPNTCAPAVGSETDVCALCVQAHCCTEFSQCYATTPGNQCGWGGPNDDGEIACVQQCIQDQYKTSGVYDDSLIRTCSDGGCATNKANNSANACGPIIGQQTSDLVACLNTNCAGPCFTGEAQ